MPFTLNICSVLIAPPNIAGKFKAITVYLVIIGVCRHGLLPEIRLGPWGAEQAARPLDGGGVSSIEHVGRLICAVV